MVLEHNKRGDRFGWGLVFSDQTLAARRQAHPKTATEIRRAFNHRDDIEVNVHGQTTRSGGHVFCGVGRKKLPNILQARCSELGVDLRYESDVHDALRIDEGASEVQQLIIGREVLK